MLALSIPLLLGLLAQADTAVVPLRVGPTLEAPEKRKHADPKLPTDARRAGLAGNVVLECVIDTRGHVIETRVLEGVPPLTEAAVKAVRRWRYEPTVLHGTPVPVVMTVTVEFKLGELSFYGLLGSLDSDNEHLRESAVGWLGQMQTGHGLNEGHLRKVINALEPLAEADESPQVRARAARALSRLDGRPLPPGLPATAPDEVGRLRQLAWGQLVDPLGQSDVSEGEDSLEIRVPPGLYDLSVEVGQSGAPRLLRLAEGDFVAEVRVGRVSQPEGRQSARERRGYHGAGLLLWQDDDNYLRLESAIYRSGTGTFPRGPAPEWLFVRYALFEQRRDGRLVGGLALPDVRLTGEPTSLRLERRGGEVRAFARQDEGVPWREVGRIAVDLPPKVLIGLAAVNTANSELVARFEHFRVGPSRGGEDASE